jgi:hypothetical protein
MSAQGRRGKAEAVPPITGRDIPMSVKMNNKCFPGIEQLSRGEKIDEAQIAEVLDFIDRRLDCADFRMVCILRSLYDYAALLSPGTLAEMKRSVLAFKYWMDEPGEDSMCYWSENHQLIFAACEYLAGQLYPDETFINDGRSGAAHMERGRRRLVAWFGTRFRLGFVEWHSNTYYEEDAAPLSLLIDCCLDQALAQRATVLMDLLLLDMALHSFRGYFAASSGRCYEASEKDPEQQDTADILSHAFGVPKSRGDDYTRLSADFLLNRKYEVPEAIRRIALSRETAETKASMGLGLREVEGQFPDKRDIDGRGMYLWSMEAFTNPESVDLTLRIFRAWKLRTNDFLRNIRWMDLPVLKHLGLMPAVIRLLNPVTQGIAIQRADTYTYRTNDYMLSTAQCHQPGQFGDQQHIWQATLPGPVSIFTTHPGAAFFQDNARNFSPGYWVGNGVNPHAAQFRNMALCLYDLRVRKGLLERPRLMFTHAWFPFGQLDESCCDAQAAMGRKGDSYAALLAVHPLERGGDSELIQRGAVTAWAVILGSKGEHGDFAAFCGMTRAAKLILGDKSLRLELNGHTCEIIYRRRFSVDGQVQPQAYERLECPYGFVPREPEVFEVSCEGHHLRLNGAVWSRDTWQGEEP